MSKATTSPAEVLRLRLDVQALLRRRVLEAIEHVLEEVRDLIRRMSSANPLPRSRRVVPSGAVLAEIMVGSQKCGEGAAAMTGVRPRKSSRAARSGRSRGGWVAEYITPPVTPGPSEAPGWRRSSTR